MMHTEIMIVLRDIKTVELNTSFSGVSNMFILFILVSLGLQQATGLVYSFIMPSINPITC